MKAALRSFVIICMWSAVASLSFASDLNQLKVSPRDKCPVCGMFVAKYPDFAARVQFRDNSSVYFDGAKDLFKYYLNPSRYTPGRKTADISSLFVTNYYDLTTIDGLSAFYVLGSDVYGPMGRELIPFARESQAREFMKDHKGKAVYYFREVTPAVLGTLQ